MNSAERLIRVQGEQILRGREIKMSDNMGKMRKDIQILQPDRHGGISEKKRTGGKRRE